RVTKIVLAAPPPDPSLRRVLMAFRMDIRPARPRQHLSSAARWKKGTHVLRRVRGGRPGLRRPLRELLPETASDRRAGRVRRRPALSVLRVVPAPVWLDEGGSRPGDPAAPPGGDAAPCSL